MLAFAPMPTGANHNKDLEYEDVEIMIASATTAITCIGGSPDLRDSRLTRHPGCLTDGVHLTDLHSAGHGRDHSQP